jgi:hypothetical protein
MARRADVVLEEILDAITGIESAIADNGLKALDFRILRYRFRPQSCVLLPTPTGCACRAENNHSLTSWESQSSRHP